MFKHAFFCLHLFIHRQKALEDALLYSGQFKEALEALLDWLYHSEPTLSEDQLVHGDIETVTQLVEQHKVAGYKRSAIF